MEKWNYFTKATPSILLQMFIGFTIWRFAFAQHCKCVYSLAIGGFSNFEAVCGLRKINTDHHFHHKLAHGCEPISIMRTKTEFASLVMFLCTHLCTPGGYSVHVLCTTLHALSVHPSTHLQIHLVETHCAHSAHPLCFCPFFSSPLHICPC